MQSYFGYRFRNRCNSIFLHSEPSSFHEEGSIDTKVVAECFLNSFHCIANSVQTIIPSAVRGPKVDPCGILV